MFVLFLVFTVKYFTRSLPTNRALESLAKETGGHEELLALFNTSAFDVFSHGGDSAAAGLQQLLDTAQPASAVNSYVRLVMNLMNAYTRDTEEVRYKHSYMCSYHTHR